MKNLILGAIALMLLSNCAKQTEKEHPLFQRNNFISADASQAEPSPSPSTPAASDEERVDPYAYLEFVKYARSDLSEITVQIIKDFNLSVNLKLVSSLVDIRKPQTELECDESGSSGCFLNSVTLIETPKDKTGKDLAPITMTLEGAPETKIVKCVITTEVSDLADWIHIKGRSKAHSDVLRDEEQWRMLEGTSIKAARADFAFSLRCAVKPDKEEVNVVKAFFNAKVNGAEAPKK